MAEYSWYTVYWRNPETRKFEALPNLKVHTGAEGEPISVDGRPEDHIKRKMDGLKVISIDLTKAWWES